MELNAVTACCFYCMHLLPVIYTYKIVSRIIGTGILSLTADRQTDASSHVIYALPRPSPHALRDVMEMNSAETA